MFMSQVGRRERLGRVSEPFLGHPDAHVGQRRWGGDGRRRLHRRAQGALRRRGVQALRDVNLHGT